MTGNGPASSPLFDEPYKNAGDMLEVLTVFGGAGKISSKEWQFYC